MRLALWQGRSPMGDQPAALHQIGQALRSAGASGAVTLVMAEAYLPGYNHPMIADLALTRADPLFDTLGDDCRRAGCGLVLGYAERDGDAIYNAAIAIDAQGQTVAHFRKIQLFGPREKALYRSGSTYTVFDLAGQKAALLICYDIEFAPHVAALAACGVTVVLVPTANMAPFDHVVRHTVPTMAANHAVTIVYANYCGRDGDITYVGGSLIVGPHGEVLAQAGHGPALLIADIPDRDTQRLSTQNSDFRAV